MNQSTTSTARKALLERNNKFIDKERNPQPSGIQWEICIIRFQENRCDIHENTKTIESIPRCSKIVHKCLTNSNIFRFKWFRLWIKNRRKKRRSFFLDLFTCRNSSTANVNTQILIIVWSIDHDCRENFGDEHNKWLFAHVSFSIECSISSLISINEILTKSTKYDNRQRKIM